VTAYGVANLNDLKGDWRGSKKNVWSVVNDLIALRHKKLKSSKKRYEKLYRYFKRTGKSGLPKSTWW
jgi:hypothetical protein